MSDKSGRDNLRTEGNVKNDTYIQVESIHPRKYIPVSEDMINNKRRKWRRTYKGKRYIPCQKEIMNRGEYLYKH